MGKNKQKKKHQQRQHSSYASRQWQSINDAGGKQPPGLEGDSSSVKALPSKQVESSGRPSGQEEWQAGDTILDIYEVKGVLGEGGMGKVYRVHHKNWNIDLAVKTPRPAMLARAGAKENFIREAETWVNLGLHPHTVSCYYVREVGGLPRVFAEYIEGGDLSSWIRTGRLYEGGTKKALERILDIASDECSGRVHGQPQRKHIIEEGSILFRASLPRSVVWNPVEKIVKSKRCVKIYTIYWFL